MFNSLNRGLAAAAHMARLNQRAISAGVAARAKASTVPSEEEVKSWTRDEVIEFASSIISAKHLDVDALKAAKLDGESLLEMRQNQSLVDALCLTNGLEPTVVYKLAGGVRKLVPEESKSKTVFISSEEDDEDPNPITFEAQSKLDGFLSRQGAGSLQLTAGTGTDNPYVVDLEKLADGDTYSMVSNELLGFASVKRGLQKVEGRLRTDAAILEQDARTYLEDFLKEKFDDVLELPQVLLSRESSGPQKIVTPDGLFRSHACSTLWILEVKVNLEDKTPKHDELHVPPLVHAKNQLNKYEDKAKVNFPDCSVVKVMAGHNCSDETAAAAVEDGFKIIQRKGVDFIAKGF